MIKHGLDERITVCDFEVFDKLSEWGKKQSKLTSFGLLCLSGVATFLAAYFSLSIYFESGGFAWAWWANAVAVAGVFLIDRAHLKVSKPLLVALQAVAIYVANAVSAVHWLDNSVMTIINTIEIAIISRLLRDNFTREILVFSTKPVLAMLTVIITASLLAGAFFMHRYGASLVTTALNWFLSDFIAYVPLGLVIVALLIDREPIQTRKNVFGLFFPVFLWLLMDILGIQKSSELLTILTPMAFASLFTTLRSFAVGVLLLTLIELTRLEQMMVQSNYQQYSNSTILFEYVFVITVLAGIAWQRYSNHIAKRQVEDKSAQLDFALESAKIAIFEFDKPTGMAKKIGGKHRLFNDEKPFKLIDAVKKTLSPEDAVYAVQALSLDNQSVIYPVHFPGDDIKRWSQVKTGNSYNLDGSVKRLVVKYDITEEMTARKSLEETTEKLAEQQFTIELAGQSAGIGFFKHDVATGIVFTDITYNRIHGFPLDVTEVSMDDIFPCVYPSDIKLLENKVRDILSNPRSDAVEYRVINNGVPKWIRATVVPRESSDGIVLHGVIQDIDDQKTQQINEQLLSTIRSLSEQAGGHFHVIHNLASDELSMAPGLMDYLGYDSSDDFLKLRESFENIHPQDRDKVRQYFDAVSKRRSTLGKLSEESIPSIQARIKIFNGAYQWFQITLCRLFVNNVEYDVVHLSDVDELADATLQAQENAHRLSLVIDAAALGVLELNLTSNRLFTNDHLQDMLEFDGNISGFEQFVEFSHADDKSLIDSFWRQHTTSQTSGEIQYRIVVPSGVKWLSAKVSFRTRETGEVIAYMTVSNITEMKTKQAELEKLVAELNDRRIKQNHMFAIIAHELRTPLSAIKMMQDEQSMASIEPYGQAIVDATDSLLSTLDDLRTVVNPDLAVSRESAVDRPDKVVKRAITPLETFLKNRGVNLHFNFDSPSSNYYLFNAQALRQVTVNLVKNAALHAGATELWVGITATSTDDKKSRFTLRVEDNGTGIDEEIVPSMFDAFVRGRSDSEGSGLGLHIAKILADRLNGAIHYEASPKGGACFVIDFTLERHRSIKSNAIAIDESDNNPLKGLKVLFVEDQKTIQMISQKMLERAGAFVTVADNGVEALKLFDGAEFDLILTDIMMPQLDGFGLTSQLRARHFAGPIIGISAAVLGEEADKMLASGATAVIPKPFSLDALAAHLDGLFRAT